MNGPQLEIVPTQPRRPRMSSRTQVYLEQSRLVAIFIFILTVATIVGISFVELNAIAMPVQPGQVSQIRVVAGASFSYESALETASARSRLLTQVPPVYRIDAAPAQRFEQHLRELLDDLERYTAEIEKRPRSGRTTPVPALETVTHRFNAKGPYRVSTADIAALLALGDNARRRQAMEDALSYLREIRENGVHADSANSTADSFSVLNLRTESGAITEAKVHGLGEALTYLRVNLVGDGPDRSVSLALFRLLSNGIQPNLVFDAEGSERLRTRAVADLKPSVVTVERGHVIIEAGSTVSPAQYEMLRAYRAHLAASGTSAREDVQQLFNRVVLVLAMVLASVLYIRIEDRETLLSNTRLGLLASVVILNLGLVRVSYSLAGLPFFLNNFYAAELLPYIVPTAFAPLIVAILIDAGSAIFMALLISIFTSVIYGNRLDLLVLTFLASLVGIYYAREVRQRSRVVKAAGLGGLVVASFALMIGLVDQTPIETILWQMGAGIGTGFITGIIVAGLLPVLESLFNRTTDITLLELTDYNHPLLRLMQVQAPGTYHHSLIVAQLSESAAGVIGANPLLCRVCALFHDIGKTEQPAYFTENCGDGASPHDQLDPAHSAAIIKRHVDKGVELAHENNLPRAVVDVIQQHHGTTRIEYFFRKARKASPAAGEMNDSAFRYDGPKPLFKESAIIFLADPVEAATRTLRNADAENLRELIERIVGERIAAGQLDDSPLTLEELAKVKTSFTITLLAMLHSRVSYPAAATQLPEARA